MFKIVKLKQTEKFPFYKLNAGLHFLPYKMAFEDLYILFIKMKIAFVTQQKRENQSNSPGL